MQLIFSRRRKWSRPKWWSWFSGDSIGKRRRDKRLHRLATLIVESSVFNWFIMITIMIYALMIALETTDLRQTHPRLFDSTDGIFLAIYLAEFIIKVYAEPVGYWKNYYNLFDFAILVISAGQALLSAVTIGHTGAFVLKIVRALRTLRILRSISFFKGLQVVVSALLQTFRTSVLYLLILLLVLMFLFATMGYNFFGSDPGSDQQNWGSFGAAMLSLFTLVTADGWTRVQDSLSAHGYIGSQLFTILFMFLGHFIFTNLFIGVIITNIHSATEAHRKEQRAQNQAFIVEKKNKMMARQHRDVIQLTEKQKESQFTNFPDMLSEFERTLRHDDFTYSSDICTSLLWMDTMLASLQHMETSRYRCQQLEYDLAWCLAQMKEEQLKGQPQSAAQPQPSPQALTP